MSPSIALRSVALFVVLAAVLAVSPLAAQPTPAPPLSIDTVYPNLFFGAIPPNGAKAPVIVFVHGLGGSYVDWIESNNCPTDPPPIGNCKSSPTSPGTGSKNDMYDYAYDAGYRTVFMSLSADNSTNNLTIAQNSAMLQTLFPEIEKVTGTSKFYFVAHSKGGLDLQSAIANPQWISLPIMVLMLGTPNQGDALADWCFGAGSLACVTFGLSNPGVESMETANVLQLRTMWDPIFQNAKIPFYTVSGQTYTCVGGPGSCPTSFTGPILISITTAPSTSQGRCGATGAYFLCNDGLVTWPETLLPTTYAMELGRLFYNHYLLRMGDYSWSYVNARVTELQAEQPQFTQVANGGFGDQHNNWSWSMAWFNNNLYVGTGREPNCITSETSAIQLDIASLYPPNIGDCTPDFHHLPLQAEIWQYNPATNVWTMVYQSPNSLSTIDNTGVVTATARDVGFRGLTVVNEPPATPGGPPVLALYAGGVTSGEIFECHPPTYITNCAADGTWPPPRIMRTTDGVTWNPIPQNGTLTTIGGISNWTPGTCSGQPCFLGSLTANGTYVSPAYPNYSVRSAAQLCSSPAPGCVQNGILFLQVGDFPGVGRVISAAPGVNPALGDNCGQQVCFTWASGATSSMPVWILDNFNNVMYAGTGSPYIAGTAQVYGVYSTSGGGYPPYTWNPIIFDGGFAQSNLAADFAMSMEIFSDPKYCPGAGCLYVGTDRPNEMVRIHPDTTGQVAVYINGNLDTTDSWDLIIGNPRTIPSGQPNAGQYVGPLSGIGQYFVNGFTGHFWRMGVGSQGLYMGTWDMSTDTGVPDCGGSPTACTFGPYWSQEYGTDVWRSPDGVNWTFVTKTGFGDGNNTGTRSSAATPYGLFMGTAREVGGTQVFNVDNGVLDFNKDGVIDHKDVALMTAKLNTNAGSNNPMDINRDGKITMADVQLLKTQCTLPNCVTPSVKPKSAVLASPLVSSLAGPQGGTVTINWSPVSGAVDYLVYRMVCSPAESQAPPPATKAKVAEACSQPNAPSICTMLADAKSATTALYGFPSAPEYMGRVTATTYSETAPSSLQGLYFVVAEDGSGNLSTPSNTVGGPSWTP
jgi:hypothetical protein